jgi:O-succinylbenzoic acid--CoA ligase
LGTQTFEVKTSGSTGNPKKIFLNRNQLKLSARLTINALSLTKAYMGLVCISIDHIGGKMMLVRAMELKMPLYIIEPAAEPQIKDLPPIDFVALIPLQLRALLAYKAGRSFLNHCKVAIVGGGAIDPSLESQLDQFQNPIYQTFGMTETVSHIALRRMNGPEKELHFHAFQGIELSLDERGCLVICGAITNNETIVTNDLVEMAGEGKFKWLGRLDQAINSGGYKIFPSKLAPLILEVLRNSGINADFTIIGLPDPKWGQKVTLVLELDDINKEIEKLVLTQLKEKMHPYEVPKSIKHLHLLPRTATGKYHIKKISELLKTDW